MPKQTLNGVNDTEFLLIDLRGNLKYLSQMHIASFQQVNSTILIYNMLLMKAPSQHNCLPCRPKSS